MAKHKQIREKLVELTSGSERACVNVSQLASRLGMDIRTLRAHLEIMEVDCAGVFMDETKRQFCTKEGIAVLANVLKLSNDNIR